MQKTACDFVTITIILFAFAASAVAQTQVTKDSEKALEKYRAMISDPMSNSGYLAVDSGEALWATKRGPKNTSLETCDLGEGPGKVDEAYAKLPRYFADVDRVMDAESRICGVWRRSRASTPRRCARSRSPPRAAIPQPRSRRS